MLEKVIYNLYEYNNYKLVLSADFNHRNLINHDYSLRKYSKDLNISLGYLSELMSGKRDISLKKGEETFAHMGFKNDEISYLKALVQKEISDDHFELQQANQIISSHFIANKRKNDSDKEEIMTTPEHFMVYSFLHDYSHKDDLLLISEKIGIKSQQLDCILDKFLELDYIKLDKNGEYILTDPTRMISKHDNYCRFLKRLSTFLLEFYEKQNINDPNTSSASVLVLPLDKQTAKEARELHKFYIKQLFAIADRTKDEDRFLFLSNLYLERQLFEAKEDLH